MKPVDYLHLQMELEGIKQCDNNLITRISPDTREFPLAIYVLTSDREEVVCFDDKLPQELLGKLMEASRQTFRVGSLSEIFYSARIVTTVGYFKTYIFPDYFADIFLNDVICFNRDNPKIVAFGFDGLAEKVYAIERDGKIVSACVSARQNSKAGEAWVFTHPDHRRKGLAQRTVSVWAGSLQREGLVPFYSHEVKNFSSAGLAQKLNLIPTFEETVVERTNEAS